MSQIQFRDSFDSDKQSKWLKSIPRFVGEILIHFLIDVVFSLLPWEAYKSRFVLDMLEGAVRRFQSLGS